MRPVLLPGIVLKPVAEYARDEDLSHNEVYTRLRSGELESLKLGKHTTLVAYHSIIYAGADAPEFLAVGGRLVALATAPLALGLATDSFVAFTAISKSTTLSVVIASR